MINWFRKYSVTILDRKWSVIKQRVRVKIIPRYGEFIFIEETNQYYKVINVIHYLNRKSGVFIIVDEFGDELPKTNEV
jgi:predicted ribosome-associated RNA-binding protein Tma20